MDTFIPYFFKVNIAFIALYIFYRLFLHRDTFFREKRFAFLFGFLFAIIHPIMDVSSWIQNSKSAVAIVQTLGSTLPEITVTAGQMKRVSMEEIILAAYFLGVGVFLIRMLLQICSVLALVTHNQKARWNDQIIIHIPKGSAPFSFLGWIFINPEELSTRDMEEIVHHEKMHAHQLHTLDVLFSELVCIFFWVNPFVWLLKLHLRENLEYLADRGVIHSGYDPKSYQYHLLRLSNKQSSTKVGNNFNVSKLKNRIIMMNKKRTSLAGLSKYALSLPLFALIFLSAYAWGTKQNIVSINGITTHSEMPAVNQAKTPQTTKQNQTGKTKATEKINKTISIDETIVVGYGSQKTSEISPKAVHEGDQPYLNAEQMPQFPGGEQALMRFIAENLRYPRSATEKGIEGRVIIRFVVGKTGEVKDVEVLKGLDPACDEEGMRVARLMPKWTPGKENGKNVAVYFVLPILYRIQKNNAAKISIRQTSNAQQPILLINGVEKPYSYLNDSSFIKPENIVNISVQKDSSAIRVYGEKGKNGVILVTTKK